MATNSPGPFASSSVGSSVTVGLSKPATSRCFLIVFSEKPSLTVGDLGCGTGQVSELVAPHVCKVIAVDGSTDMVQAARRRLKGVQHVDVRRGDMAALSIDDAQLDVAIVALVLHHVPEPARVLSEVGRVLKPGGRVLIVDMLPHDREDYQQQMGHVWLGFSEKTVRKYLEGAGFERPTISPLPTEDDAKGPSLFVATARKIDR